MTGARKFTFDRDFRSGTNGRAAVSARAEEDAYARGLADGQAMTGQAVAARLAATLERLEELARALMAETARQAEAAERDAAALALAFARKLAGAMLAREPLGPLEDAARECFRHLRGVPHLVVRVSEALVEEADAALRRIGAERGFEGRIVVLGEPDLAPGDARLEWADGGMARDGAGLDATLAAAIARVLAGQSDTR